MRLLIEERKTATLTHLERATVRYIPTKIAAYTSSVESTNERMELSLKLFILSDATVQDTSESRIKLGLATVFIQDPPHFGKTKS